MFKLKRISFVTLLVLTGFAAAQSANDTINKTDETGKRQGYWIITNAIAQLPEYAPTSKVEEGRYIDARKEGLWRAYFPSGKQKSRITFKNNRPNGYAIIYHENGKVFEEGLWQNNRWVGAYKLYYDNGQVAQEFNFNPMGKREGAQKYYYENGQLMIEGTWAGGKESGLIKEYHENGDIKSEKYFNGGDIDPAKTRNYEPKKPVVEIPEPEVAKKTPPIIPDKEEKPNLQVFNGEGYWKLYNKNKQISKDGDFSKGRLINGKVYHYNSDGILQRIAIYKDGVYVGDGVIEEDK